MKAMILAAGLGTRLRPLTNDLPKALVEINGKTLLEITIARLAAFGVSEIILNVHHFAEMVVDYLKSKDNFGLRIEISREDDLLLDTGGGLKKASWFFLEDPNRLDEPFLLHNVDVISTVDLRQMLAYHTKQHVLATLAVQQRRSSRQLLFDEQLRLCGRRIHDQDTVIAARAADSAAMAAVLGAKEAANPVALAFSGIHAISPRLLLLLTETGAFSIIDAYLRLASQCENIRGFRVHDASWRDLGRLEDLAAAASEFK